MSQVYLSTKTGHSDYEYKDRLHWCATSITKAAKRWTEDVNDRLLNHKYHLDSFQKPDIEEYLLAMADSDMSIQEIHRNIGDHEESFAAPDFTWVTGDFQTLRPQLKWSSVLRELKNHGYVCFNTVHSDHCNEQTVWRYVLETHESI